MTKIQKLLHINLRLFIKQQNSMFQKIYSRYLPHIVLTVGKINFKILKKNFQNVFIIGSSRHLFENKKFFNYKIKKRINCLVSSSRTGQ